MHELGFHETFNGLTHMRLLLSVEGDLFCLKQRRTGQNVFTSRKNISLQQLDSFSNAFNNSTKDIKNDCRYSKPRIYNHCPARPNVVCTNDGPIYSLDEVLEEIYQEPQREWTNYML